MPADPSARASDLAAAALTRSSRALVALRTLAATIPDDALLDIITQPTDLASLRALIAAADAARPPAEPLLAAALDRGRDATADLLAQEGGALTLSGVATMLCVPIATIYRREAHHTILAIPTENGLRFPACQFVGATTLNGIPAVVKAMTPHGSVVTLSFLLSPSARLPDDARPIDLLRAGRVAEVIDAASRYGEHGG
jgi:hypothetical protein